MRDMTVPHDGPQSPADLRCVLSRRYQRPFAVAQAAGSR